MLELRCEDSLGEGVSKKELCMKRLHIGKELGNYVDLTNKQIV